MRGIGVKIRNFMVLTKKKALGFMVLTENMMLTRKNVVFI